MPLRYRLLGLALFAFWVGTMWLLIQRDLLPEFKPPTSSDYGDALASVEAEKPTVDRLAIYLAGVRLGYTQSITRKRPEGGYAISGESRVDLGQLTRGLPVENLLPGAGGVEGLDGLAPLMRTEALVSDSFRLERFDVAIEADGHVEHILGEQVGNKLVLTSGEGAKAQTRELPFDGRSMLGGLLFPGRFSGSLELGHSWEERFVDPFRGTTLVVKKKVEKREQIAVAGQVHEAFVVTSKSDAGGPATTVWVDLDGRILREQRGFGLRLEREEPPPEVLRAAGLAPPADDGSGGGERPAKEDEQR